MGGERNGELGAGGSSLSSATEWLCDSALVPSPSQFSHLTIRGQAEGKF